MHIKNIGSKPIYLGLKHPELKPGNLSKWGAIVPAKVDKGVTFIPPLRIHKRGRTHFNRRSFP